MNNKTKFVLSAILLYVSPLTFAVSDCPADECIITTPDNNDSMGDTGSGDSSNSEEPMTEEQCKAIASGQYYDRVEEHCHGLGTFTLSILTFSLSIDEYNQCVTRETARRDNAYEVCSHFKNLQTQACL